jgi:hypothetical protein
MQSDIHDIKVGGTAIRKRVVTCVCNWINNVNSLQEDKHREVLGYHSDVDKDSIVLGFGAESINSYQSFGETYGFPLNGLP